MNIAWGCGAVRFPPPPHPASLTHSLSHHGCWQVGSNATASGQGGFVRLGGTYTDSVDYVGFGADAATPCDRCIVLTPSRWRDTLEFFHSVGMRVTLNLNAMHGRTGGKFPGYGTCGLANNSEVFPPWNWTQSEALLRWTASNIPSNQWPSWVGLGNEKTGLIPTHQYVADLQALTSMLSRVFTSPSGQTGQRPSVYAPCGCSKSSSDPGAGSVTFLDAVAAEEKKSGTPVLGAFSWHSYPQICKPSTVESETADLDGGGGVLFTAEYYDNMAQTLSAHPPGSALSWITESAYTCAGPANASRGGANAAVDPMLRAVDMPW
jgi:hypothetical protein